MYAWSQDLPINDEIYERIRERLGNVKLDGLIVHLAIREEHGHLRYIDVWESETKCDAAFAAHIHPAVYAAFKEIGLKPAGEPTRIPIDIVEVRVADGVVV
ncbi:MAG: hypothetical protein HYX53_17465 [Chloroflexi bacterium]|nr:hypothetical protein [Chloroflexota bacterium]